MTVAGAGRGPSPQEEWDELFGEFYLRVHGSSQDAAEAEVQALAAVRLADCPPGGDVLDAPCGFGRHSVPLARAGYRVVGVDRSETLLAEAARRAGADAGRPVPELVRGDYRELPFGDASFDAALNLFTSLGYLGDEGDTDVLAEIGRVLRPGGRLVIEMLHRDQLVRILQERTWRMVGEGRLLLEQHTFDGVSGVAQTTQTLVEPSGERESRSFSVRVYTATELVAMLLRAGFAKATCHGSLDGAPFDGHGRLVVVARR